eukprot:5425661-Lingulodinium_polyedra.AAC.1
MKAPTLVNHSRQDRDPVYVDIAQDSRGNEVGKVAMEPVEIARALGPVGRCHSHGCQSLWSQGQRAQCQLVGVEDTIQEL